MLKLDPHTTALVLIDLQKGILSRDLAPYKSDPIIKTSQKLADQFRNAGAPVILVNVDFAKDFKDALRQPVDQPMPRPPGGLADNFGELVDDLTKPGDIHITKRQWSAFYGTEMDLQLRRRGIQTIVLGGVATNMGVESTARQAWEHGYAVVIVEDMMSSFSDDMHRFAVENIFPRMSRVVKNTEIDISKS